MVWVRQTWRHGGFLNRQSASQLVQRQSLRYASNWVFASIKLMIRIMLSVKSTSLEVANIPHTDAVETANLSNLFII